MKITLVRLLLLLFVMCLPAVCAAQFRYAPVVGVTVNNLAFKQDLVPVKHAVGFEAGVMGELMFPGLGFGMDFGLLYNMEGAKVDLGSRELWASQGIGNDNLRLHTLQIPVHLRFKWTRMNGIEDYIAPFVYGGPEFGICVGHSGQKQADGQDPFRYAGGDLGLAVGGGFELWRRWQVSCQYTWGMTYITKTRKLDDYSARNRQLAVRVAYMF